VALFVDVNPAKLLVMPICAALKNASGVCGMVNWKSTQALSYWPGAIALTKFLKDVWSDGAV